MDKALWEAAETQKRAGRKLDWRRRMSDNVAYALLTYTGLQIFVTMGTLKNGSGSILPYFALIVLVAAIIPGCRMFEKRWDSLTDLDAANPELRDRFRRDQIVLWICAIALPLALTGSFVQLALLSVISRLFAYVGTAASLFVLRRRFADRADALRLPGGPLIPAGALVVSLTLLASAGWKNLLAAALALAAGAAIYAMRRKEAR